ncbi:MAG: endonuclease Q family protein [Candidatus Marsarchaeota archaeon]|nr:endonuclease Q family protein [Candidatus Marsarchaeota archaeon]
MACSEAITLPAIDATTREKGINLISTGDFTHPAWLKEIKSTLEPAEDGLFKVRGSLTGTRFMLGTEVSTVYEKGGKSKRIHHVVMVPDIDSVDRINEQLSKSGDLSSDGRPQLSISSAELVETVTGISKNAFIFPAHIWTPHFGVLGMKTGFDSMHDAYEGQEKNIYAVEMGLSSNSPMNWRVSKLDKYALLGNSDMHSLPKIGREMNVFEIDEKHLSFSAVTEAIKKKDKKTFKFVLKFYPEEGKYHFDGHRQCLVSVDPEKYGITKCPICGKRLTVGVMHRVNDLADRPAGYVPKDGIPYVSAVPLREVISYVTKKGDLSVAVEKIYKQLVSDSTEFEVLVNMRTEQIAERSNEEIAQAIRNMRAGNITVVPGYDGVFGKIDLLNREKNVPVSSSWKQKML